MLEHQSIRYTLITRPPFYGVSSSSFFSSISLPFLSCRVKHLVFAPQNILSLSKPDSEAIIHESVWCVTSFRTHLINALSGSKSIKFVTSHVSANQENIFQHKPHLKQARALFVPAQCPSACFNEQCRIFQNFLKDFYKQVAFRLFNMRFWNCTPLLTPYGPAPAYPGYYLFPFLWGTQIW